MRVVALLIGLLLMTACAGREKHENGPPLNVCAAYERFAQITTSEFVELRSLHDPKVDEILDRYHQEYVINTGISPEPSCRGAGCR